MLTTTALCWTPSTARSDEVRVVVEKGQRAPFSGVLLTREALAELVTGLQRCEDDAKARLDHLQLVREAEQDADRRVCRAEVEAEKAKADACQTARSREANVYQDLLKGASRRSWWSSPAFMTVLGVAAGVGVCAVAR